MQEGQPADDNRGKKDTMVNRTRGKQAPSAIVHMGNVLRCHLNSLLLYSMDKLW